MKKWKKLLTAVLTAALVFTLLTGSVCATGSKETLEKTSYLYTVVFYAGNQGTFGADTKTYIEVTRGTDKIAVEPVVETDKITVSGLQKNDRVSFVAQKQEEKTAAVVLGTDSKYYVKGVRESGRDNSEVAGSIFEVTADKDYVVAYGIKGQQVKYTVNYHDKAGKELVPSDTFYGNVGDKPVVAYKYIAGYAPQAFGLTKTLVEDESENVFTFVYEPVPTPTTKVETETVETTETVEQIIGNTVVIGGGTGGSTGGGATNVTGDGTAEEAGNNEETGTGDESNESGDATGSDDLIVDLDDEETPLANIDAEGDADGNMAPMALYVGMGLLALIAIIVAVYLTQKLKKKEEA